MCSIRHLCVVVLGTMCRTGVFG
ncbi:hypothetical protein F383_14536 [Gossypium arboreum]|uniref:Uncharacterized protein n=1 Tax=Gossypium arboreum TaxID=29729 RepID=A0A0B0NGD7_GOSAR|nr:hypothetical protein F383_14536 [Gossypium arboreum]